MTFAVYVPDAANKAPCPVVYWLSGLTCTDENFCQKAGAFGVAAELGLVLVMPDTSPRGTDVPDEDPKTYDFGVGAGFYLDSCTDKYKSNFKMYSYVVNELPELVKANFPVTEKMSITGHSMGGHGAMTIALKNPEKYVSVSAFSPICHPVECPWGQKAFELYLGTDKAAWAEYDTCALVEKYASRPLDILVDQGTSDNFLTGDVNQLRPDDLEAAIAKNDKLTVTLRRQPDFDHSYFFIASFIGEHLKYHSEKLKKA